MFLKFLNPFSAKPKAYLFLILALLSFSLSAVFAVLPVLSSRTTAGRTAEETTGKKTVDNESLPEKRPQDDLSAPPKALQKTEETANQKTTPAPTPAEKAIPTSAAALAENRPTPTATPTPAPSPADGPMPTPVPVVSLEVITPDKTSRLVEELKNGANVCDLLTQAEGEGKLQSLTIDNSYLATLKSAYIYEINGYKNNWTFTVNGTVPRGCSLSLPKAGDVIVWKFSE